MTCSPRAHGGRPSRSAAARRTSRRTSRDWNCPATSRARCTRWRSGLAVNSRGADHNRSGAYEADLSGDLDRFAGGDAQVAAAVETEDRAAVMDSLILCKFLRGVFREPFEEWAAAARPRSPAGTSTAPSCARTARRIVLAKRVFNLREGWQPGTTGCRSGCCPSLWRWAPAASRRSRRSGCASMIDGYYAVRGLDPEGRPAQADIAGLGLR